MNDRRSWRLEAVLLVTACGLTPCLAQNNKVRWSKDYIYANGQILATVLPAGGGNARQVAPLDAADLIAPGASITLKGSGFRPTSLVNIYSFSGSTRLAGPIEPESVTSDSLTFRWPTSLPSSERVSIRVVDGAETSEPPVTERGTIPQPDRRAGTTGPPLSPAGRWSSPAVRSTGNLYSRYADLVPGYRVTIHSVAIQGSTVTITGRGFTAASIVRFANLARGELKELGLWHSGGTTPKIALTLRSAKELSFELPSEAGTGAVCIQVLNPPYSDKYTSPLHVLRLER